MFKTNFSGYNIVWEACAPRGYDPEGSADDQSITKGIARDDERLYPYCQLC